MNVSSQYPSDLPKIAIGRNAMCIMCERVWLDVDGNPDFNHCPSMLDTIKTFQSLAEDQRRKFLGYSTIIQCPFYDLKRGNGKYGFKEVNNVLNEIAENIRTSLWQYYQKKEKDQDYRPSFEAPIRWGNMQLARIVPELEDPIRDPVWECVEFLSTSDSSMAFNGVGVLSVWCSSVRFDKLALGLIIKLAKNLENLVKENPSLAEVVYDESMGASNVLTELEDRIDSIHSEIWYRRIDAEQASKITKPCPQCGSSNTTCCYEDASQERDTRLDEYTFYCRNCGFAESKQLYAGSLEHVGFIGLTFPWATICPYCGKSSKLSRHPKPPKDLPKIKKETLPTIDMERWDPVASARLECARHPVDCSTCSLSEKCPLYISGRCHS